MSARARTAAVTALLMVATACGPSAPLQVGVKEINTDVLIGPPERLGRIVLPPGSGPIIGFPGIVEPPVIPVPPEPGRAVECPAVDPLATVAHPITAAVTKPPVAAAYTFRDDGVYTIGAKRGALPKTSIRRVGNIQHDASGDSFTFDVAIPGPLGLVTTTTYHVYPDQPNPVDPTPGIYIDQTVITQPGKQPRTFTPVPSLELLQFPASPGVSWSARGVDPSSQTVMGYDATITRKDIVDACGTKVEAWVVDISNGTVTNPIANTNVSFQMSIEIAPQYGGLSVLDKLNRTGTEQGEPVSTVNTSRITSEPKVPS